MPSSHAHSQRQNVAVHACHIQPSLSSQRSHKNSRFIVKPDSYPDELLFLSIWVDCSPVTVFRFGHLLLYTVISCKEATLIEILVYSVRTLPHHLHVLRQCCLSRSFTNNFIKVFRCAANWLHRVLLLKRRVAT